MNRFAGLLYIVLSGTFFAIPVHGQTVYCWNYTDEVKHFLNRSIKESKDPLILSITKNALCEVSLTDNGFPNTVRMNLKFTDTLGYLLPANDILRLNFQDGSRDEIMMSSKKVHEGTLSFILVQPENRHGTTLTEEDQLFYNKLRNVDITSLAMLVDNHKRVIPVSADNAEFIRRVVGCLAEVKEP